MWTLRGLGRAHRWPVRSRMLQKRPEEPRQSRCVCYIFDCGTLDMPDPGRYNFKREELATNLMSDACFLIVHPQRDTVCGTHGVVPDGDFKAGADVNKRVAPVKTRICDGDQAAAPSTGRRRIHSEGHHLRRVFALSLRSRRQRECVRRVHVAGAAEGTRHHVRRAAFEPHGASQLRRAEEREDGDRESGRIRRLWRRDSDHEIRAGAFAGSSGAAAEAGENRAHVLLQRRSVALSRKNGSSNRYPERPRFDVEQTRNRRAWRSRRI